MPLIAVDSYYYGQFVFTPWNIVKYNVFGKGGPDLYGMCIYWYTIIMYVIFVIIHLGVEPWSFYFVNGFLNFNIVFILALLAIPLIEFKVCCCNWSVSKLPS